MYYDYPKPVTLIYHLNQHTMKSTKTISCWTTTMIVLMLFSSVDLRGQYADPRAAEILELVRQQYEQSIRNIDDYTVITEDFTARYKKVFDNGRPYFVSQVETEGFWGSISSMGMHTASPMDDSDFFTPEMFTVLKENARYLGTETVDGLNAHVILFDEMRMIAEVHDDLEDPVDELRLYFDDEHWVLRQMTFTAHETLDDGTVQTIEPRLLMTDYRNIEGMMIPFKTIINIGGFSDYMSDAEREEAVQALAEMERELAQMPDEQREMIEQMMSGQLDQLRQMLEDDTIEFIHEIKEVKVNTGID